MADFNQDQATLDNLKSTRDQMETNLQNANFFSRRRRERELDQAVEDFERQYALMESKYRDTGLGVEDDLSQVYAIIGEYRAYAKGEATMQTTLQEALDEYGRWERKVKEAKATLARYPYDNSRIKAHQALVRTLLKNRSIITNQKRNMAEIEKNSRSADCHQDSQWPRCGQLHPEISGVSPIRRVPEYEELHRTG